jgi:hypothetical protein
MPTPAEKAAATMERRRTAKKSTANENMMFASRVLIDIGRIADWQRAVTSQSMANGLAADLLTQLDALTARMVKQFEQ